MTGQQSPTPAPLRDALAALADLADQAGLNPAVARQEGLALAAAVLEQAGPSQVHRHWAQIVGAEPADFFAAAPRGRRYAAGPTALLAALVADGSPLSWRYAHALADVATAACTIEGAGAGAVGKATVAGAAQLSAAGGPRTGAGAGAGMGAGMGPGGGGATALPPDTVPGGLRGGSALDLGALGGKGTGEAGVSDQILSLIHI